MWDVDFKTAVAQAEVEDRPRQSAYVDLRFAIEGGGESAAAGSVVISTTRPELLGACVALAAHPDDERYRDLFGRPRSRRSIAPRCRSCAPRTPIPRRAPAS